MLPYSLAIRLFKCLLILANLGSIHFVKAQQTQQNIIIYQAVGDVKRVNFNNALEQSLQETVRSYLGADYRIIVKVNSQLRLAKTYRVISEQRQNLAKTPASSSLSDGTLADNNPPLPTQNSFNDSITLNENTQSTNQSENDVLPLPGSPVVGTLNTQEQTRVQQRNQTQSASQNAQLQQLQQQLSSLRNTLQQTQRDGINQLEITQVVTTKRELIAENIEIQKLSIKVWVPDTINAQQENIITDIMAEKTDINFIRGDTLELIKIALPSQNTKIHDIWQQISNDLLYWLVPFLLLILLLFFWWLINRRKRTTYAYPDYPPIQTVNNDQPMPINPQLGFPPNSPMAPNTAIGHHESPQNAKVKAKLDVLNDEITSTVILGDDLLAQYLGQHETGTNKQANFAYLKQLLGHDVFAQYAKGTLPPEVINDLNDLNHLSIEEQYQLAIQTRQALNEVTQKALVNRNKPFDFLNKMSNKQLLYLLSKENAQTQALLLSQLDSQRLADIIAQLPLEGQGQVAVEIGKLTELPLETYQQMANYLARKASQVPDFKEVNIDGDEVIIRTLEEMDTAGENTILNSLRERNPDQFYRIKKSYISFSDLANIELNGLKNLLREIEREHLAIALYDEEDHFREKLIQALPSRSKALITQLLQTMAIPSNADIVEKKKTISRHARQLLKAGVIQLHYEEAPTMLPPSSNNPVKSTQTPMNRQAQVDNQPVEIIRENPPNTTAERNTQQRRGSPRFKV